MRRVSAGPPAVGRARGARRALFIRTQADGRAAPAAASARPRGGGARAAADVTAPGAGFANRSALVLARPQPGVAAHPLLVRDLLVLELARAAPSGERGAARRRVAPGCTRSARLAFSPPSLGAFSFLGLCSTTHGSNRRASDCMRTPSWAKWTATCERSAVDGNDSASAWASAQRVGVDLVGRCGGAHGG